METKDGVQIFYPESKQIWRNWLEKHHQKEQSVWVLFYKKGSDKPSISWSEAVDEALCFGWIDSKPNKRDEESYYRYFSQRNSKSIWSKINKEKIEKLTKAGKMAPAGLEMVRIAKEDGTWNTLDEVDNLMVPSDLLAAFNANQTAYENWEAFPPSSKKIILYWIMSAKREETRAKRISETVDKAEQNIRANHWR